MLCSERNMSDVLRLGGGWSVDRNSWVISQTDPRQGDPKRVGTRSSETLRAPKTPPCSKEVDCETDEVCSTLKISFEVSALGQTASAVMKTRSCGTADADADAACEAAKTGGDTSSFFASLSGNLDCEISTCETDLCNSGFTARVSVLVLVAAAVAFYGLF